MSDGKTTILIVDDSPLSQRAVTNAANESGLNVIGVCKNGLEALNFLADKHPSIISIDVIMPVMDGLELHKEILKRYPQQKMIFVTALGNDRAFLQSVQDRIPSWLIVPKPINQLVFNNAVKESLVKPNHIPKKSESPSLEKSKKLDSAA